MMPVSCHVKWSGVPFVGGPTHTHIRQMNLQLKNPSNNKNNNKNTDFTNTCLDQSTCGAVCWRCNFCVVVVVVDFGADNEWLADWMDGCAAATSTDHDNKYNAIL